MLSNIYKTKSSTVVSGGREHFPMRDLVKAVDTYEYEVQTGDTYYTLAASIFSDDSYWWVLADLNKPFPGITLPVGTVILLPRNLVSEVRQKQRIL